MCFLRTIPIRKLKIYLASLYLTAASTEAGASPSIASRVGFVDADSDLITENDEFFENDVIGRFLTAHRCDQVLTATQFLKNVCLDPTNLIDFP